MFLANVGYFLGWLVQIALIFIALWIGSMLIWGIILELGGRAKAAKESVIEASHSGIDRFRRFIPSKGIAIICLVLTIIMVKALRYM